MPEEISSNLIADSATLRLAVFLLVLFTVSICENLWPRRPLRFGQQRQWSNYGLSVLNTLVLRVLMPWLAIDAAVYAEQHKLGLFHYWSLTESDATAVLAAVVYVVGFFLLDVAIYWQHRAMHAMPLLWRLHRVHHCDHGFDCSTGLRFHPLEIILSMSYKIVIVLVLGVPLGVLIVFEIVLNASSLFNHGNLNIPVRVDSILRRVIVTPDMHRIHHSERLEETNSNYGFSVSFWDRLFRSYRSQPQQGQLAMQIGLREYQAENQLSFAKLLTQPFRRP